MQRCYACVCLVDRIGKNDYMYVALVLWGNSQLHSCCRHLARQQEGHEWIPDPQGKSLAVTRCDADFSDSFLITFVGLSVS